MMEGFIWSVAAAVGRDAEKRRTLGVVPIDTDRQGTSRARGQFKLVLASESCIFRLFI